MHWPKRAVRREWSRRMGAWKLARSSGGVSSENDKELKSIDSMMKYMKIRYDDEI